jgi:hypothetical protein
MSAQPPDPPPPPELGPPPGRSIGPPGGVFGPPGGLRPPPPPPLPQLPQLTMAPLTPAPVVPGAAGPVPGGAAPLGLPDLQAVGRAAMADVLEGDAAQAAARERLPDLIELARQARIHAPASGGAPVEAAGSTTAPADVRFVAPAQTGPVPGLWRAPAPPPPPAPRSVDVAGRRVGPRTRDAAQRIGDRLYPLVERIRESRGGLFWVIALFGITVPIILLRQEFDVRVRLALGFFTAALWFQLVSDLFGG